MTKLAIVFEDVAEGLALGITQELAEAVKKVEHGEPVSPAEAVAVVTLRNISDGMDAAVEMAKLAKERAARGEPVDAEAVFAEFFGCKAEPLPEQEGCTGDCENCTQCEGNKTVH